MKLEKNMPVLYKVYKEDTSTLEAGVIIDIEDGVVTLLGDYKMNEKDIYQIVLGPDKRAMNDSFVFVKYNRSTRKYEYVDEMTNKYLHYHMSLALEGNMTGGIIL